MTWSSHVKSWTEQILFPVCVLRYEDTKQKPVETFEKAVRFSGVVGINMKKKLPVSVRSGLKRLGTDLKNARLRCRLKMVTIADRAGISRETLAKVQKGDPGVSMGSYASVISRAWIGYRVDGISRYIQ